MGKAGKTPSLLQLSSGAPVSGPLRAAGRGPPALPAMLWAPGSPQPSSWPMCPEGTALLPAGGLGLAGIRGPVLSLLLPSARPEGGRSGRQHPPGQTLWAGPAPEASRCPPSPRGLHVPTAGRCGRGSVPCDVISGSVTAPRASLGRPPGGLFISLGPLIFALNRQDSHCHPYRSAQRTKLLGGGRAGGPRGRAEGGDLWVASSSPHPERSEPERSADASPRQGR